MQPDPETRFLTAIARAAREHLGAEHPLTLVAGDTEAGPRMAAGVQELLATLEDPVREQILGAAHRIMREDIAAIWDFLPGAAQSGGLH